MHAGNIRTLCHWFEDIEPTCIRDESGWFSNRYSCLSENDYSIWEKGDLNADVSLARIFLKILSCYHNEYFVDESSYLWRVQHYSEFDASLVVKS